VTNVSKLVDRVMRQKCRLGVSRIHGVGLFALVDLAKGENPFPPSPRRSVVELTKEEVSQIPEPWRSQLLDLYVGAVVPSNYPAEVEIAHYINHSYTPNIVSPDGGFTLIAARDISAGEELTVDYRTYATAEQFPFLQQDLFS
jgi:SET domain-containing protein